MGISNFFIIPQLLYIGMLVPVEKIPSWLRWAEVTCFLKHATNIISILDFGDEIGAQVLFEKQYVYKDRFYTSLATIFAIGSVTLYASVFILKTRVSGEGPEKVDRRVYEKRTEKLGFTARGRLSKA